jgi:hypothetical protein
MTGVVGGRAPAAKQQGNDYNETYDRTGFAELAIAIDPEPCSRHLR